MVSLFRRVGRSQSPAGPTKTDKDSLNDLEVNVGGANDSERVVDAVFGDLEDGPDYRGVSSEFTASVS